MKGWQILWYYITCTIVSAALLFFTRYYYGIYYGWCFDTVVANYIQGIFMDGALIERYAPYFVFFGNGFSKLYKLFPHIAWYGWFFFVLNIFAAGNMLFVLLVSLFPERRTFFLFLLFSIGFYFSFCAEHFILLDFTRTAIFLSGSSLLCIAVVCKAAQSSWVKISISLFFLVLFFVSLLIRFDVVPLCIAEAMVLFVFFFPIRRFPIKIVSFAAAIGFVLLSFYLIVVFLDNDQLRMGRKLDIIMNVSENMEHNNDLKASVFWTDVMTNRFFADDKIVTIGAKIPIRKKSWLRQLSLDNITNRISAEYQRSAHLYDQYNPDFSYLGATIIFTAFGLLLILIGCISGVKWPAHFRSLGYSSVIFLGFWFCMLVLTIFMRMEDRFLLPNAAICLLAMMVISLHGAESALKNKMAVLLCIIFCVMIAWNKDRMRSIVATKKQEIKKATDLKKYIHEQYKGQVINFDFWTQSLFIEDPLINSGPDNSHIQISYGEFNSSVFIPFKNKIRALTKTTDNVDDFLTYASQNNVRFLVTKERKDIFERYAWEIYHKRYILSPTDLQCPIYQYSFCGLPYRYEFGVYICTELKDTK